MAENLEIQIKNNPLLSCYPVMLMVKAMVTEMMGIMVKMTTMVTNQKAAVVQSGLNLGWYQGGPNRSNSFRNQNHSQRRLCLVLGKEVGEIGKRGCREGAAITLPGSAPCCPFVYPSVNVLIMLPASGG